MRPIYQTETLLYGPNAAFLQNRLQDLIDLRTLQGWKLFKFEMCDKLEACIVIFEKYVD